MKSLYIIPFLFLSVTFYAQESRKTEVQDQEQVLKEAIENAKKMQAENKPVTKNKQTGLASDNAQETKQETQKTQNQNSNQGKLLPSNASFEEVLSTIPNRQASRKPISSKTNTVQGLPNTATLEEIKKTIPKN